MKQFHSFAACAFVFFSLHVCFGEIYTYTEANGTIRMSDQPITEKQKELAKKRLEDESLRMNSQNEGVSNKAGQNLVGGNSSVPLVFKPNSKKKLPVEDTLAFWKKFIEMRQLCQKSLFEKEADFKKRIPQIPKNVFYFSVPLGDNTYRKFKFKYDPESEVLDFDFSRLFNATFQDANSSINMFSQILDNGSYIAQNAFGAKVTVKKRKSMQMYFRTLNINGVSEEEFKRITSLSLKIPPDSAKALLYSINMIVGVTFKGYEFAEEKEMHFEPKVDTPTEGTVHEEYIDCNLVSYRLSCVLGDFYELVLQSKAQE